MDKQELFQQIKHSIQNIHSEFIHLKILDLDNFEISETEKPKNATLIIRNYCNYFEMIGRKEVVLSFFETIKRFIRVIDCTLNRKDNRCFC